MKPRRQPRHPPRLLDVIDSRSVSPNVLRMTLGGEKLTDFPEDCESANIKLLLAHEHQNWEEYLGSVNGNGIKPIKRTYTVLNYRPSQRELDIDFALHPNPGPATRWALQAQIGDQIAVAGPGTQKLINMQADWFLFFADLSSLPALEVNLSRLSSDALGYAFIQITSDADKRILQHPNRLQIRWLETDSCLASSSALVEHLSALRWLDGQAAAWAAGEASMVKTIKDYLITVHKLDKAYRYTSGYWMHGRDEDGFQPYRMRE